VITAFVAAAFLIILLIIGPVIACWIKHKSGHGEIELAEFNQPPLPHLPPLAIAEVEFYVDAENFYEEMN